MREACQLDVCDNGQSSELSQNCTSAFQDVMTDCNMKTLRRFKEQNEYNIIGAVSLVHVILPFVITLLLFINLCIKEIIQLDRYTLLKFPIPPIAKSYRSFIEIKTFSNNTKKPNPGVNESRYKKENEKEKNNITWVEKNDQLMTEMENQNKLTNISMMIEAGTESSFQFLFQSLYILPTVLLAFDNLSSLSDLTDLVDWKFLSILMSFVSFAWSSFNIRLEKSNF